MSYMDTDTPALICCTICKQDKPPTDFYVSKGRIYKYCKACAIEKSRLYLETRQKTCTACGEIKALRFFPITKKKPFRRRDRCVVCVRLGRSTYRKMRTPETTDRRKNRVLIKKKFMLMFLKDHPCIDCGEKDPVVLEFDHREKKDKKYGIAALLGRSYSLQKLMLEVEKCDVRCSNCHRRRTSKQEGWNWLSLLESDLSACLAPE